MVTSCSAHGCVNRLSKGSEYHFFSFPLRNPERNAKWIKAVGRKGFIPTKNSRLCNKHFVKSDFKYSANGGYKLFLNNDAVPSIFNTSVKQIPTKTTCSSIFNTSVKQIPTKICSSRFNTSVKQIPTKTCSSRFNTSVKQIPTKTCSSRFNGSIPSQLNIFQLSDIPTNVSNCSNTTVFSTPVQDEPLCLTLDRNMCSENAKKDVPLLIASSKCNVTVSLNRKIPLSRLELKNKLKTKTKTIKILMKKIQRKNKKINTLKGLLKFIRDRKELNS